MDMTFLQNKNANSANSSVTVVLSTLNNDLTKLQELLSSTEIDTSSLNNLQVAQTNLSMKITSLGEAELGESDFLAFNKALSEVQILLIKLTTRDFLAQSMIKKELQKIFEQSNLLNIDTKIEQESQQAATVSLQDAIAAKNETEEALGTTTLTLLEAIDSFADDTEQNILALKSSKLNSNELAKVKALANTLSVKLSDIQKLLERKSEQSTVLLQTEQLKTKTDIAAVKALSRKLDTVIDSKVTKTDFSIMHDHLENQLQHIDDKVSSLEPSEFGTKISEYVQSTASNLAQIRQYGDTIKTQIAEQELQTTDLRQRIKQLTSGKLTKTELEEMQKRIGIEVSSYADMESVTELKSRLDLLWHDQKITEEDLGKLTATVNKLQNRTLILEAQKVCVKEVWTLIKQYTFILRDLRHIKNEVTANTESLDAENKLYVALQGSLQSLLSEMKWLHGIYNKHVASNQDVVWVEETQATNRRLERQLQDMTAEIASLRAEIAHLEKEIPATQAEISLKEPLIEPEKTANMELRTEYEEKLAILTAMEKQVADLETEIATLQEEIERKTRIIATETDTNNELRRKLTLIGGTLEENLIEKDLSSFAENLRITNRIKEISDVDCSATAIGAKVSSDSDILTYERTAANSARLTFAKKGNIELITSGSGTLTFTNGVTGIATSRSISAPTTIVLNAANLSASAASDASGFLFTPGTLSFTTTSGLSVTRASLIYSTEPSAIAIPDSDVSRTSAVDGNRKVTFFSAATVTDPAIATIVADKALNQFDLDDRNTRLSAIGNILHTDLITPDYDNFSYNVNIRNKIKGAERQEITNCSAIAANTPTTSSDGKLTYTKNSASGVESGGTITFTETGALSIITNGAGTLEFTNGVQYVTKHSLNGEKTVIKIPSDKLLDKSVTFTLTSKGAAFTAPSVSKIVFDTEQISTAPVSVPLAHPTVTSQSDGFGATLSGKVSETVEDPTLSALMSQKNAKIASKWLDNTVQIVANETLDTANKALEQNNAYLEYDNADLEKQKTVLPTKIQELQEELVGLREAKAGIIAQLKVDNEKLTAIGSSSGLVMDLIDPKRTQNSLISNYRNFNINLTLNNVIPHISRINDSTAITPPVGELTYTKKWKETYSQSAFPASCTLNITTSGTGTLTFTSGVTGVNPVACSGNKVVSLAKSNLSSSTIEYNLSQGLNYSLSTLIYSVTGAISGNQVSYTKNWNIQANKAAQAETSGSMTLPWSGKVELTTSGSGTLKIGSTSYSPKSNLITISSTNSFNYTISSLAISNIKYYYYDTNFSSSVPSTTSFKWTKKTKSLNDILGVSHTTEDKWISESAGTNRTYKGTYFEFYESYSTTTFGDSATGYRYKLTNKLNKDVTCHVNSKGTSSTRSQELYINNTGFKNN